MSIIKTRLSFMLLLTTGISLAAEKPLDLLKTCNHVPLVTTVADAPLSVSNADFMIYMDRSAPSILLTNHFAQPISMILVLVDYRDELNKHLLTGIFYGALHGSASLDIQSGRGRLQLLNPLKEGDSLRLSAVSSVAVCGCPAKGIVTRILVEDIEGKSWKSSEPWKTDPEIKTVTNLKLKTLPAGTQTWLAEVRVDKEGHAYVQNVEGGDIDLLKEMTGIGQWRFKPGQGDPTSDMGENVRLLISVYIDKKPSAPSQTAMCNSVPSGLVVDILRPSGLKNKPLILVGGAPAEYVPSDD